LGGRHCFLIIWWDLSESSSNKISAGTGDVNAENWEGDNSESVLESLAISFLVVESCFDSSRRGGFLVDDSGVNGEPFLFRYFIDSFDDFLFDDILTGDISTNDVLTDDVSSDDVLMYKVSIGNG
jgi:hypothetical protein